MEKQIVLAVFDRKISHFVQVHTVNHTHEAYRAWSTAITSKKTPYCDYIEDYDLYQIGHLDLSSGLITPEVKFLINMSTLPSLYPQTGGANVNAK